MDTAILRSRILDLAIHGQLVPQDPSEGTAADLLEQIAQTRANVNKSGHSMSAISPITTDVPFSIPENWVWVRLPDLCRERITDGTHRSPQNHKEGVFRYVTAKNIEDAGISEKNITYVTPEDHREIWARCKPVMGDVLLTKDGSIGRATVNNLPEEFSLLSSVALIKPVPELVAWYLVYYLRAPYMQDKMLHGATGTALKRIVLENIKSYIIPLPPLNEQRRIVSRVEELLKQVDIIEQAQLDIRQTATILRSKILDKAFCGELTKSDIDNWRFVKLADVSDIARGGSPRPIKQYITDSQNGINWIKIGDTEKGGKYINSCNEKIIPEGIKRSRLIHPGDFLLTNSMSFGRPYISNVEGCIHDGWLVISPHVNTFDKDFLYYLLSSPMVYRQFSDKASGSTVSNLNIEKVALTEVPLPPLNEQQRIVAKIEELFHAIDQLSK